VTAGVPTFLLDRMGQNQGNKEMTKGILRGHEGRNIQRKKCNWKERIIHHTHCMASHPKEQ
jgi:hypothetical protein